LGEEIGYLGAMCRTFIVGAGFSAAGGLPIGQELAALIIREAKRGVLYDNILQPDLERYLLYVERTERRSLSEAEIDFEQFMSFLDVEHYLRLSGSDTWTTEGGKSQMLVRHFIAKVLWERQRSMPASGLSLYDYFASKLTTKDHIISFNYDTVVEDSLDRRGLPYRLVPGPYKEVHADGGGVWGDRNELTITKLHGSIDWSIEGRILRASATVGCTIFKITHAIQCSTTGALGVAG
jgi:hypothetical protein